MVAAAADVAGVVDVPAGDAAGAAADGGDPGVAATGGGGGDSDDDGWGGVVFEEAFAPPLAAYAAAAADGGDGGGGGWAVDAETPDAAGTAEAPPPDGPAVDGAPSPTSAAFGSRGMSNALPGGHRLAAAGAGLDGGGRLGDGPRRGAKRPLTAK